MAVRSAQLAIVAASIFSPGTNEPSSVNRHAPTWNFDQGLCALNLAVLGVYQRGSFFARCLTARDKSYAPSSAISISFAFCSSANGARGVFVYMMRSDRGLPHNAFRKRESGFLSKVAFQDHPLSLDLGRGIAVAISGDAERRGAVSGCTLQHC